LIAVAAMLLPTEVIARAASERAEGALGVPVVISDLELKFWPSPSVALLDARLGSEASPVARVDRILLRPRLVPLLRGQVTVREITIDRPDVFIAIDSSGALNLPFGGSEEDVDSSPSTAQIDFAI